MMASKLFLCNFSSLNTYQTFFHKVCVVKIACYFCPHFYNEFVAGSLHHRSIIFEQGKEVCFCCLECLWDFGVKTDFSGQKKDYFTNLTKLLIQYYYVDNESSFKENVL